MRFQFYIGGYNDSFSVSCEHHLLTCERFHHGERIKHPVEKDVSGNPDWERMMHYLSTRKWKEKYADPGDLDGTSWELEVISNDFTLRSSASNVYPPGFRKFLRLLNEVLKEDDVHVY